MKGWLSTTMPKYRRPGNPSASSKQQQVFGMLSELLQPYSRLLVVRIKSKDRYELSTDHSFRSQTMHPKNKRGRLFAGILILKNYTGLYFYPLHISDAFHTNIATEIRLYYKGGSAFQFTEPLSEVSQEKLSKLFLEGWKYYQQNGWVPADQFLVWK